MSYNPNIPVITDPILQSSRQIRQNFISIDEGFYKNHVGLTQDNSIAGMHETIIFRTQSDPTTTVDQVGIYTKLVSGVPNLFYAPNSAQTPIQMTFSSLKVDDTDTQYSFVAGPFVIFFGRVNNPTNGQTVILSPTTTLIFVDLCVVDPVVTSKLYLSVADATNITGSQFKIEWNTTISLPAINVFYTAIGIP